MPNEQKEVGHRLDVDKNEKAIIMWIMEIYLFCASILYYWISW